MKLNRRLLQIALAALLLALPALPALAHHGWGGNEDAEFEMSGTLVKAVTIASLYGGKFILIRQACQRGGIC